MRRAVNRNIAILRRKRAYKAVKLKINVNVYPREKIAVKAQ